MAQHKADAAEYQASRDARLRAEREKYVKSHPDLSEDVRNAILHGSVTIGMSTEDTIASRGKPGRVNTTVTSAGTREQWVYGDADYLYFSNGRLSSWQTRR